MAFKKGLDWLKRFRGTNNSINESITSNSTTWKQRAEDVRNKFNGSVQEASKAKESVNQKMTEMKNSIQNLEIIKMGQKASDAINSSKKHFSELESRIPEMKKELSRISTESSKRAEKIVADGKRVRESVKNGIDSLNKRIESTHVSVKSGSTQLIERTQKIPAALRAPGQNIKRSIQESAEALDVTRRAKKIRNYVVGCLICLCFAYGLGQATPRAISHYMLNSKKKEEEEGSKFD